MAARVGFPTRSVDPPRRPVPQGRNTAAVGAGGVVVNRPTRNTPDGDAYLDIQKMAKADGRSTDELLALYALEGFLDRLSSSSRADDLVLKGGVLLAAYDTRRPPATSTCRPRIWQATRTPSWLWSVTSRPSTRTTVWFSTRAAPLPKSSCLLYTSDAADE